MGVDVDAQVRALHERAIVIDGHSDVLIPVTENKMRIGERAVVPPLDSWEAPPGLERHPLVQFGFGAHTVYFGCMGQYDLPRWKEGGVTAQLCAIYLSDDKLDDPFRRGMEMVWNLHEEVAQNPDFVLATTAADIRQAKRDGHVAAVLTFEGCEALGGDARFLDLYYRLGLRSAALTHTRRNIWADGCWAADKQGGLTAGGKQLIERMQTLGIVIDLVHIGDIGYFEILELARQPVILTHTTPTMFPNSECSVPLRNLLDGALPRPRLELPRDRERLEALATNGGVLGLIWVAHEDLDSVVRDIETALEIIGPDHVGLGSDHYGAEMAPRGLEDISKVPAITQALVARGHSDEVILKFLGENYLRVFEQVWGA